MIYLENHLSIGTGNGGYRFGAVELNNVLNDEQIRTTYQWEDVVYSIFQLIQEEYIVSKGGPVFDKSHYSLSIGDILFITPKGHTFLSKIQNQKSWGTVKPILEKVGSISLSAIEAVANGVTTAMIGKYIRATDL